MCIRDSLSCEQPCQRVAFGLGRTGPGIGRLWVEEGMVEHDDRPACPVPREVRDQPVRLTRVTRVPEPVVADTPSARGAVQDRDVDVTVVEAVVEAGAAGRCGEGCLLYTS